MGFKYLKKNAVSITLLFAMVLNLTAIQPVNVFANEVQKKTETAVPVDKEEKTENQPSQSNNVTNEYNSTDKQDISKLLEQQKFTVSNPDISMKTYEKWNGVLIKGNYSSITESTFTFEEELDFGTYDITNYIVVDGLAAKKKNFVLDFYLDNEKEAFTSVKLNCQGRKDYWNHVKNVCQNIKGRKITGKHKVSFKVVTDDKNNVTFLLRYIFFMKNNLPVLDFEIDESEVPIAEMNGDSGHNTECYGKMSLEVPDGYISGYNSQKTKPGTYSLEYIRGRGNSTWSADKKPYKIKLMESTDFFGMGKNKHWVLLANYYDVTLIRNKITYWLGEEMGMKYTPQCVFVDVIMNHKYIGSYYLCEQVRVGKSRVNIDDLEMDDISKNITTGAAITGGYLLGMSPYTSNDNMKQSFSTIRNNSYVIESPSFDDYFNQSQYNYISDYVQKTEDAIYGENFKDSNGKHYSEYMDIDAAIDYYWVQEISSNGDAYGSSSTYLYKERNGKLFWGPLWDFDYVAWGNVDTRTTGFDKTNATWFEKLIQDKLFVEKLIARWPAFKEKLLYACKDGGQIDQYTAELASSQKANYIVNNMYNESWSVDMDGNNTGRSFESEVNRLKEWISDRVQWIDNNINTLYPKEYNITYMSDGKVYKKDIYIKNNSSDIGFPEPPVKKGYVFKGWYIKKVIDGKENEIYVKHGLDISEDTVFYAGWIKENEIVKATGITFIQEETSYYTHNTLICPSVYTLPFNSEVPEVTYKISDSSIASISESEDGDILLNALNQGDTTLTATTKDGLVASMVIHVVSYFDADNELQNVKAAFSIPEEIVLEEGSYGRISPKYVIEKTPYVDYVFGSSDTSVAETNITGYVYAKKAGTAYIAVTCNRVYDIKFCKVIVKSAGLKKGMEFSSGGLKYETTRTKDKWTARCTGISGKPAESITVPGTVIYNNIKLEVTEIGKSAFEGCKKLQKVVIGKNITVIGDKAFYKCKSLKLMDIKSKKLKKAGVKVIDKTSQKFKIKAPDGKYNKYAKIFKINV
ncbi:MAG: CotH kinase family protein [Lachnospiraceae bacterium]